MGVYVRTGSLRRLTRAQVLIGRKDTHIFVIELATGRVLDSIVTSDEEPQDSIPFGGHWPPGCVLLAASTYTVKGLHPLAPENTCECTYCLPTPDLAQMECRTHRVCSRPDESLRTPSAPLTKPIKFPGYAWRRSVLR